MSDGVGNGYIATCNKAVAVFSSDIWRRSPSGRAIKLELFSPFLPASADDSYFGIYVSLVRIQPVSLVGGSSVVRARKKSCIRLSPLRRGVEHSSIALVMPRSWVRIPSTYLSRGVENGYFGERPFSLFPGFHF